MNFSKRDYLTVVYDEGSHPYTDYPSQLCHYLFQIFNMKEGMHLLEPGCGRGEFLKNFSRLGLNVKGLDLSPAAANIHRDLPVGICNVEKDDLPFPDNSFDIVYNKSFLEHLRDPDKFFRESYRVLKPEGLFICLVPDWEANYKIYFDDYTHRTPYTKIALKDIYNIHAFRDVDVFKFRQLPIVWRHPWMNIVCSIIAPFVPVRTKNKFLRWSRELMLVGSGRKPLE